MKSRLSQEFTKLRKKYRHLDPFKVQDIMDEAFVIARSSGGYKSDDWIVQSVKWDLMDLDKAYARRKGTWNKPVPPEPTAKPHTKYVDTNTAGVGEYSMDDTLELMERKAMLNQIVDLVPEDDKFLFTKYLLDRPLTRAEQKRMERLIGYLRAEVGDEP